MFVPSLSWQNDRFHIYILLKKRRFSHLLDTSLKAWHVRVHQVLHRYVRVEVMAVPAHASLRRLLHAVRIVVLAARTGLQVGW
eukprot:COSAG06_NODE_36382_length_447_cov_7.816092_2_plen_82_part_01